MNEFALYWMPHPDQHDDTTVTIMVHEHIEMCFREAKTIYGSRGLSWEFDGDGWNTQLVIRQTGTYLEDDFVSEAGNYYIARVG